MFARILVLVAALFSQLDPGSFGAFVDRAELLMAQVVSPRATASEATAIAEGELPRASVQLELVQDPDAAEALAGEIRRRLASEGSELPVFVEAVQPEGPDAVAPPSFRVGVGPFGEFEGAERARARLDELGITGFVREIEPLVGC